MSVRNLDKIFKPRAIAFVGATSKPHTVGAMLLKNLRDAEFKGNLMLVNPHYTDIAGMPVYPDVASLPAVPDLAVIATPPAVVPETIAELGAKGARGAVVITAGFGELGVEGKQLEQQILDAAKPYLLRVVGPNSVGLMAPGAHLNASFAHLAPKAGGLAFLSQSGAIVTAMLDWAEPRGIGFSHVVSLGDMADVDFGDMLDYLGDDAGTRAILLYIEGLTHARKFMSAARAAARRKPVLVVKVGRYAEGARAAASHTGALAGSDRVYDAAFRRAGMLRVRDITDLFDAVETLSSTHAQTGDRLAILTNGGGPGVLATDMLIDVGGTLAALSPATRARLDQVLPRTWSHGNPIDIVGDADPQRYKVALEALLEDREIDAVLVINCPTAMESATDCARVVIETVHAEAPHLMGRNVLTNWLGEHTAAAARQLFSEAHIATYDTPDRAIRGFMHRVQFRRNQQLLLETPPSRPETFAPDAAAAKRALGGALRAGREWLEPDEVAAVLVAYGIPLIGTYTVPDAAAAAEVARKLGKPVALKIRSRDIRHKSDIGGVALNLGTPERVRSEADAMLAKVSAARPTARLDGFVVQEMVQRPGALELIVGVVDDPLFGPVILFGQGGTAVEVLKDSTLELPPLNMALARAQIARTRVYRLMQGYRNQPPANIDAVADILIRLAQLVADHATIAELDINPLLADDHGVLALDARLRVRATEKTDRFAIRPYPKELEGEAVLQDGTSVHLRPVRPEDEPGIVDLVAHQSPEDLRMRFFTSMRGISHELAARLTQIDYDREVALVAEPPERGVLWGVGRFAADPDNIRGEYAVAVRTDIKGRGLGYLLMTRLLEIAKARGLSEIFGEVLRENGPMLKMARELGFTVAPHPDEADVMRVTKRL
ncbi:MAG TPA: bifunctional acetate--CoA ligase family protein/GNAT family N-acetyltransferase [Stellaceae bacterium]|nr:bifunctional acetate--CoA ligase family protein/GNAT family N-acetyltransferase [Stellaceae bacterium]